MCMKNVFHRDDVWMHNTEDDCWIIHGHAVYDVTAFLHAHPRGSRVLLKHAGQDVTSEFNAIHSMDAIKRHKSVRRLGSVVGN